MPGAPPPPPNIVQDAKTVAAMIRIYCRDRHGMQGAALCPDCRTLAAYAEARLARCPFGSRKTTCRVCPIHCYRPAERAHMADVMRHSGPKMTWAHPLLTLRHLWLERQGPPDRPATPARRFSA
jgi:hypothetical protein